MRFRPLLLPLVAGLLGACDLFGPGAPRDAALILLDRDLVLGEDIAVEFRFRIERRETVQFRYCEVGGERLVSGTWVESTDSFSLPDCFGQYGLLVDLEGPSDDAQYWAPFAPANIEAGTYRVVIPVMIEGIADTLRSASFRVR